jgi:hypothetical protein
LLSHPALYHDLKQLKRLVSSPLKGTIEILKGHILFYTEVPFMLFNGIVIGLDTGSEDEERKI